MKFACDRARCDSDLIYKYVSDGLKDYKLCKSCYEELVKQTENWKLTVNYSEDAVGGMVRHFVTKTRPDRFCKGDEKDTKIHIERLVLNYNPNKKSNRGIFNA